MIRRCLSNVGSTPVVWGVTLHAPEFRTGPLPISKPGQGWAAPATHHPSIELIWRVLKPSDRTALQRLLDGILAWVHPILHHPRTAPQSGHAAEQAQALSSSKEGEAQWTCVAINCTQRKSEGQHSPEASAASRLPAIIPVPSLTGPAQTDIPHSTIDESQPHTKAVLDVMKEEMKSPLKAVSTQCCSMLLNNCRKTPSTVTNLSPITSAQQVAPMLHCSNESAPFPQVLFFPVSRVLGSAGFSQSIQASETISSSLSRSSASQTYQILNNSHPKPRLALYAQSRSLASLRFISCAF